MLENLALRQQLGVLKIKKPRPRLRDTDRILWVLLRRLWPKWRDVLIIVQPETVTRWHREGFRKYWRWKSRTNRGGRPAVDAEIRDLVHRMVRENPTWGAPHVHGELQMLGFDVSERTVARYMPRRPVDPDAHQRWMTFLRNHRDGIAAMDFFTVPTVTFQVLYVLFIIHHARRKILHVGITPNPTAAWICQRLREAFPDEHAPRYLIFDRDGKFGHEITRTLKGMGVKIVRTAYRSPWQNGVAERWVLSVRQDLLNNVIVLDERHLRRMLRDYIRYYNYRSYCPTSLCA
ncbi:integrase core domain-containing protein [Candidatus Eisenbacteria bacterium]|uniref:Integrase core domain-containing protein n=1 Tax=Eiseniibacteriota bacterium TaxID=2212470 RepID=A0ABV6YLG0_UNCEI